MKPLSIEHLQALRDFGRELADAADTALDFASDPDVRARQEADLRLAAQRIAAHLGERPVWPWLFGIAAASALALIGVAVVVRTFGACT